MTKYEKMTLESEEFVRRVLVEDFGQKPSEAQIQRVAKKVREALPRTTESKQTA